jgi:hypothetical protein
MALINFSAENIAPAQTFDPIPLGDYLAMITGSEMKQTQAGTGEYLALTFEIIDGEHQSRRLWANLNLNNPNQKAVEIAQRDLSSICHAIGKLTVADSEEMHDIPLTITVGYEMKDKQPVLDGQGRPRNQIKAYKKADGAPPAPAFQQPKPAAAPATATAPAKPAGKPAAPWAKK